MKNPTEPQSDGATLAAFTARKWRQRNATTTSQYQRMPDGAPGTRHFVYPAASQPAHARLTPLPPVEKAGDKPTAVPPNAQPSSPLVAAKGDVDLTSQPQQRCNQR